jgi:hypothetical protein
VSAPFLWIILPILIGGFCLLLVSEHATAMTGGVAAVLLALVALLLPIDDEDRAGFVEGRGIRVILGRSLLPPAAAPLLAVIFGLCALWFFGGSRGCSRPVGAIGFMVTGLLVAASPCGRSCLPRC